MPDFTGKGISWKVLSRLRIVHMIWLNILKVLQRSLYLLLSLKMMLAFHLKEDAKENGILCIEDTFPFYFLHCSTTVLRCNEPMFFLRTWTNAHYFSFVLTVMSNWCYRYPLSEKVYTTTHTCNGTKVSLIHIWLKIWWTRKLKVLVDYSSNRILFIVLFMAFAEVFVMWVISGYFMLVISKEPGLNKAISKHLGALFSKVMITGRTPFRTRFPLFLTICRRVFKMFSGLKCRKAVDGIMLRWGQK